jgi:hypothetical protein
MELMLGERARQHTLLQVELHYPFEETGGREIG